MTSSGNEKKESIVAKGISKEGSNPEKEKVKKAWYTRWWAITLFIFIGIGVLGNIFGGNNTTSSLSSNSNIQEDSTLELTTGQIFAEFKGLTDIQISEKLKEFEGKRIKTSISVSKINQATFSLQYVAMEMYYYPYNLMPYVKAFFPAEEKDNLVQANVGDTLIFSGKLVTYHSDLTLAGLPPTPYIEFTDSKVIEIKKNK